MVGSLASWPELFIPLLSCDWLNAFLGLSGYFVPAMCHIRGKPRRRGAAARRAAKPIRSEKQRDFEFRTVPEQN